ncbi:MAG: endonuclease/exonuclease/phosphatase [Chitinophagaceae bacterium]
MRFFFLILLLPFAAISQKTTKQFYKVSIVGFYNLENLFDTIDNPLINDDDFTPKGEKNYNTPIYYDKLDRLARVISEMGTDVSPEGPAILGVAEVENDTVLVDLVKHKSIAHRNYQIVHYNSKDARGIDVGLLYNPKYFKVLDSKSLYVPLPTGSKEASYTRDVLWVKGLLDGEVVHIMVNHWPSRVGGEERSAPGRAAAASVCKKQLQDILETEPNAKVVIMGDLNDDPVSPSVYKILNAKQHKEDVKPGGLYNPWIDLYKNGIGTLAYQDAWGLFDQIIISEAWLPKTQDGFFLLRPHVFNPEYMVENKGRFKGYPMRTWDGNTYRAGYSDHFPTYLVMIKKMK